MRQTAFVCCFQNVRPCASGKQGRKRTSLATFNILLAPPLKGHILPHEHATVTAAPVVRDMRAAHEERPAAKRGVAARELQRAAAATAAAPTPEPALHPNAAPQGAVEGSGLSSGVTIQLEKQKPGPRRDMAAPGPAREPAPGPRVAIAAVPAPAPAPHHGALAAGRAGGSVLTSGATLVKEEEAQETLGQQRDRLALALARGPVWVDSHIKVEDSTSGEDTDEDGKGEGEVGPGGEGEGEEAEGPGGEEGGDGEGSGGEGGEGSGGERRGWCRSRGRRTLERSRR